MDYSNLAVALECERSITLARLAYRLTHAQLDREDANWLIYEAQPIAGWFAIETISVDSVLEAALTRFNNSEDELRPLAEEAARRVWNKWDSGWETSAVAEDWALDVMCEYAEEDGVTLIHRDGNNDDGDDDA